MFRFLVTVILLALAVATFAIIQGLTSRIPSAAPGRTVAPTSAPLTREAAQSFDQKVGAVATASAQGSKQPVHLMLSEQEVASKIQQSLASREVDDLQDVSVRLADGQATLSGTANLHGISAPVEAGIRLGASRGLLTVEIVSLKAAGIGLPDALQRQLTDQVREATGLNDLQNIDLGIDVQRVQVANGRLLIDGQTQ